MLGSLTIDVKQKMISEGDACDLLIKKALMLLEGLLLYAVERCTVRHWRDNNNNLRMYILGCYFDMVSVLSLHDIRLYPKRITCVLISRHCFL